MSGCWVSPKYAKSWGTPDDVILLHPLCNICITAAYEITHWWFALFHQEIEMCTIFLRDILQSPFFWFDLTVAQSFKNDWVCDTTSMEKVSWIFLLVWLSFPLCFWLGSHPTLRSAAGMLVLAALRSNWTVQKENPLKHYSPLSCFEWGARLQFFPILVKRKSRAR